MTIIFFGCVCIYLITCLHYSEDNMLLLSSDRDQINPFLPKRKTDFKTFVNSINWSELDLKEAEEKLTHGTHVTRCLKRGGVPAQVRAQ